MTSSASWAGSVPSSQYDRFSNAKLIEIVETKLHTLREYQLRQLIETLDRRLAQ